MTTSSGPCTPVATVPEVVEKLVKLGFGVTVETGAGAAANFDDAPYEAAGARIAASAAELYAGSDMIFKVRAPTPGEIALMKPGSTLVSFVWPSQNPELMQSMAGAKLNIHTMMNKSKGDVAYTLVDVDSAVPQQVIDAIAKIEGVLAVRYLPQES